MNGPSLVLVPDPKCGSLSIALEAIDI